MFGVLLGLTRAPWRALRWCGRKWRWIAGFLVVLIVAHATAALITGHMVAREIEAIKARGEPVSLKDLTGPPVSDAQNAALLYEEAIRRLPSESEIKQIWAAVRSVEPGRPSPAEGAQAAKRILARNAPVFRLLQQAAARPACRFPYELARDDRKLFTALFRVRMLAHLLIPRAILDASGGNSRGAFDNLALLLQTADRIGCERVRSPAELVRGAMLAGATRALPLVIAISPPSRQNCKRMQTLLGGIHLIPPAVRSAQAARCRAIALFDQVRSSPGRFQVRVVHGHIGSDYSFLDLRKRKPGLARRFAARLAIWAWAPLLNMDEVLTLRMSAEAVRMACQPYRDLTSALAADETPMMHAPWYAVGTRTTGPGWVRLITLRDLTAAQIALDRWVLALRVCQIQNGSYPDSLAQVRKLVGWRLPEDPFSGTDFIYHREGKGYVLYSVGLNLKDDGGMDTLVWERTPPSKRPPMPAYGTTPDIVWRMAR
jgi:hypothetical protein